MLISVIERLDANLVLKAKFKQSAEKFIRKLNKKKKIYVGVHVRKTDRIEFEKILGLEELRPSYYLQAMDLFRNYFGSKNCIFLVISDDAKWCQSNLIKKQKDVFIASQNNLTEIESVGHDLAIMSQCNHTIMSRGTFSFWSSYLAGGGATVLPCHLPAFRSPKHDIYQLCNRNPLENPLPRLFSQIV